jgi:hypothetical protein
MVEYCLRQHRREAWGLRWQRLNLPAAMFFL